MSKAYETRPTEEGDVDALNALYTRLTGIARDRDQWRWEWRDGPLGPAPSFVIVQAESGAVVGHHGVVPVPLSLGGRGLAAARTENSMVDPDHRGRFMYPAIEAALLRDYLPRFDLVFTTAGGGAPGAVRRRLGYGEVGSWHSFGGRGGPAYVLARTIGGGRFWGWFFAAGARREPKGAVLEDTRDAEALAGLWRSWRQTYPIAPDRTAAFLDWRLFRHPYTPFQAAVARAGGEAVAALAWREVARGAAIDVTVEDIFCRDRAERWYELGLLLLAARYRGKPARLVVRTLADGGPLARAAKALGSRPGAGGSPFFVRARSPDLRSDWAVTPLLGQGI